MIDTQRDSSLRKTTREAPLLWRVWVNWPGDAAWAPDAADVSSDVVGLRWGWGRRSLPVPEFAPPAELELTLRNRDHRYTPGNASGPLGANVSPGRAIWLRVSRMRDDFATENGSTVNLAGRSAVSGGDWYVSAASGNGFIVADGEVMGEGGGWPPSDSVALLDTGEILSTFTATYRRGSNGQGGFALRCSARDDCLRLRFGNTSSILERVSGRTVTRLSEGVPLDAGTWYDLEIEQNATGVRVHAVALGQADAARREILAATGITDAPASGRHGLWHGFRNAQDRWGEFTVGRSLFNGSITDIDPDHESGTCRIVAHDVMKRLDDVPLHRALPGGLMRSGNVAAAILGWAGMVPGDYALDDGRLLLTGGPRSVWDASAAAALRRLQREEHGFIYTDGLGRVRMEAASVRATLRESADPPPYAKFSVSDTAAGVGPYATALRRDDGADSVEDSITFRYRRSADAGRQQVWNLGETLELPAGEERVLLAATDSWDAIDGLNAPAADTDYAATDDAAGAGTDVTGDITVELVAEADSGIAGRGQVAKIRNDGSDTAYLQRMALHADHCWRAAGSSSVTVGSRSSDPRLGSNQSTLIACRYADNYAATEGAAQARLDDRSRQRPHLNVTLPLLAVVNHAAVTEGRLSDVVEVLAATLGIAGACLIEGMEITVNPGGEGQARWWLTGT